jgi:mono/diheme cytochrome c family protein
VYIYKFFCLVLLGAITVVYTNCGSPFSSQTQLVWKSNVYGGADEASYAAFEATVYPITRENCASCHTSQAPKHASPNPQEAHDEIMMGQKVNFSNIPASRMVRKLRDESHNCWSDCAANADEMEDAIVEWNAAIESSGPPIVIPPNTIRTVQTMTIDQELANIANPVKSNTVALNVGASMVNAPMVKGNDGFGDFIHVPDDGTNATLVATDVTAGVAMMNMRIPAAGTYRIWGYVLAPDNNSNAFYAGIAPTATPNAYIGGIRTWDITANANPRWQLLNQNYVIPSAGNYTLTLRERRDGTKIYRIFVTADTTFNGEDVESFLGVTLSFDMSTQVGSPNVRFLIDVSDYDSFTYLLANPRIVTPTQNIRVKGVRLFVNNVLSIQSSAYSTVDKIATPTDQRLSGFPMIVLKESGGAIDRFHFTFEELEVYTGVVNTASLTAFQTTVYPISVTNCANCHSAQRPHASPDALTAHDYVLGAPLVNFNTPSSSLIVTKIRNGHQSISPAMGASIASQYEAAIMEWRTQRGSSTIP